MADLSDLVAIFDLDGTLVDSAPDLTDAMNAVLAAEGLPTLSELAVRHLVGDGARALLRRGYEADGRAFPEGEAGDALVARFIAHYRGHLTDRSRAFPGAEACLDRLSSAGAALAVCTNKPHALAVSVLEQLGLMARFAVVLGRDSLPVFKPDPGPLLAILDRTGRSRGAMVGDTMTDVDAARAVRAQGAAMPLYYARYGYGADDAPLRTGEQRFDHLEALFDLVAADPAA